MPLPSILVAAHHALVAQAAPGQGPAPATSWSGWPDPASLVAYATVVGVGLTTLYSQIRRTIRQERAEDDKVLAGSYRSQLAERDATIAALEGRLIEKDARLADRDAAIKRLVEDNNALRGDLAHCRGELAARHMRTLDRDANGTPAAPGAPGQELSA